MPARILIIEDNQANHELVEYLLKTAGYTTLSAWDGIEGLRITRQEAPHLILCDLQMPKMNGYEVIKQLKADAQLRQIPVIAVTASSMSGDSAKARAAGFDGYISKPIEPESFTKQIEEFLPPDLRA